MNLLKSIKLRFKPPKLSDPVFGELTYMYISNHPERSYWEAEWIFPPTETPISVGLDGDESGPKSEFREWYLSLPSRFPQVLESSKPELAKVFKSWLDQELPTDIFKALKLTGFSVQDPKATSISWDIAFETTGAKWLGITIPFIGDEPQNAVIDT